MPVGSAISMQAPLASSLGAICNRAKRGGAGRWLITRALTGLREALDCLFAATSRWANSLRHAKNDGSETPRFSQYW
jgi:hypothetical protein